MGDNVFPPALRNQLDKVLSGIKINNRQSFTEMKDYEKGVDSIYSSAEQSDASNALGNVLNRKPRAVRPALKKTQNQLKNISMNA